MKLIKTNLILYFLFFTFTFSLNSCASKKNAKTSKKATINKTKDGHISKKNLLYLINGKEVTAEYINTIATDHIESITVIKGEKDVAKYTDKKYDGVIIIKMKKSY
jgi:hypothetical protein